MTDSPTDAEIDSLQADPSTLFDQIVMTLANTGVHPSKLIDGLGTSLISLVFIVSHPGDARSNWSQIHAALGSYFDARLAEEEAALGCTEIALAEPNNEDGAAAVDAGKVV